MTKYIQGHTPEGKIGYWVSQWPKGVWLSRNKGGNGQIFPIFVDQLPDVAEWEVTEEEVNL